MAYFGPIVPSFGSLGHGASPGAAYTSPYTLNLATVVSALPSALRSSSDTIANARVGDPSISSVNAWIPEALANVPRFWCPGVLAPARPLWPSRVTSSLLGTRPPSTRNDHAGAVRICTLLSCSHLCMKTA